MLDQDLKIKKGRAFQKNGRERNFEEITGLKDRGQNGWATHALMGGLCLEEGRRIIGRYNLLWEVCIQRRVEEQLGDTSSCGMFVYREGQKNGWAIQAPLGCLCIEGHPKAWD